MVDIIDWNDSERISNIVGLLNKSTSPNPWSSNTPTYRACFECNQIHFERAIFSVKSGGTTLLGNSFPYSPVSAPIEKPDCTRRKIVEVILLNSVD